MKTITEKFLHALKKLILLDYDGTLVNFSPVPSDAKPSKRLLSILKKLTGEPQTKVVIITGRDYQDIDALIGQLPIDIIAEHGAMVKENGGWKEMSGYNTRWKKDIFPLLNEVTGTYPGSFIEEKRFSLAWHYRKAEEKLGWAYSEAMVRTLNDITPRYGLRIITGNKVVEIISRHINKGKAVRYFLKHGTYDFVLAAGDDTTDEDMFNALSKNKYGFTIKVGNGKTSAGYKLETVDKVLSLLENLSAGR
ncbi:MAG: trehalose-phosphatase [Bacteroidetes bacterium]|nr:trehalose-phosphatase [Bacteroidota bacterium]